MNNGVDIGTKFNSPLTQTTQVGPFIGSVISKLYIIAGVVLLAMILWGGFQIIAGAGSEDKEKAAHGRQIITFAIIGFLIIFASYWIIRIVELITHFQILS